uniref:Uncharacterized protein LOC114335826 n=1 Tax=Diabrotica virgifera virgifera TaxID=50390 RepID=A0A6P7FZA7_DIAVI
MAPSLLKLRGSIKQKQTLYQQFVNSFFKDIKYENADFNYSQLGISQQATKLGKRCNAKTKSVRTDFQVDLSFLVIPTINECLPSQPIAASKLNIPNHLQLADSTFHKMEKVNILLGAGIFFNLLSAGQICLGPIGSLVMQKTVLRWIISGPIPSTSSNQIICRFVSNEVTNDDLQSKLKTFWEIEEPSYKSKTLSGDVKEYDKECEEIFQRTTKRDSDGRLIVTIPLKKPVSLLGESKDAALKRLNGLETRLRKNANLSNLYRTFTQEHMSVGHMSTIYNNQEINQISYYMPHYVVNENFATCNLAPMLLSLPKAFEE